MSGDHHIHFADWLSGCDKPMPDIGIEIGSIGVPRQNSTLCAADARETIFSGRKAVRRVS